MYDERSAAADTLEAAADLMESVGWTKGTYVSVSPTTGQVDGYCSVGALRQAQVNSGNYFLAAWHLSQHLRNTEVVTCNGVLSSSADWISAEGVIAAWNDHLSGGGSDVIDTFKTVAKDLRNDTGNVSD